jgi:hypothetical protein
MAHPPDSRGTPLSHDKVKTPLIEACRREVGRENDALFTMMRRDRSTRSSDSAAHRNAEH